MNLYIISQSKVSGYDTYDSAVVAAKSPKDARKIHPGENKEHWDGGETDAWSKSEDVDVEYLGKASRSTKRGVILASFRAG